MSKPSARGLPHGARPVVTRIFALHHLLGAGSCPSLMEMAERLEVSARTIERDLEQLRDFFGAPLVYDRARRGYSYRAAFALPRAGLTEGELAVLLMGQRLLLETAGTPFAEPARRVLEKLPLLLPDEISVDLEQLSEDISFGLPKLRGDQLKLGPHFQLLRDAIDQCRTVAMTYHTLTRDAVTERCVDPYHLRLEAGAWYLIGHCHLRGEIRIFAVDRIESARLSGEGFYRPADFNVEEFLGHSWSLEKGREYKVRVAFSARQARWIRERIWQEGQKIEETPDGGAILELRASGLGAIKRWVLSFGRYAKVLEPAELAEAVREEARGILDNDKC